nr:immunoglobulin heavy chain junction region [Mus musculus]MBK4187848.1 immunoglobulin heavy chain junction region [Mus musculus]
CARNYGYDGAMDYW